MDIFALPYNLYFPSRNSRFWIWN